MEAIHVLSPEDKRCLFHLRDGLTKLIIKKASNGMTISAAYCAYDTPGKYMDPLAWLSNWS